jgi:hypothetical protein
LTGILVGIGALVVVALVVFLLKDSGNEYRSEDTPDAVVHNYILAVTNRDYEKAYSYLADLPGQPSSTKFEEALSNMRSWSADYGATVGEAKIRGTSATVDLNIISGYDGPFGSRRSSEETARLISQDGKWKIRDMPYPFWGSWY